MRLWKRWRARRRARALIREGQPALALAEIFEAYGKDGLDIWLALNEEKDDPLWSSAGNWLMAASVLALWAYIVAFLEAL